jgi:Protein of unknown function (DUF2914)
MLRRLMMLITLLVLFAVSGAAADLVSMKLCPAKDYDPAARDCAKGKGLEGSGIQIDPSKIGTVDFLTAVKATKSEDIYHVWIHGKASNNVMVYDSATKTLRDAEEADLMWLKERNITGAKVIVKMTAEESDRFRLRSSKTVTPSMTGAWKVQVYDSTDTKPLGEMEFTLGKAVAPEQATN